ncbi:MAG: hypothetical protein WC325_09915, partial [Candidatus Bathyarchaeia archaeon]
GALGKNQWIDFTVYVKQGSGFRHEDGIVTVWINGAQVFTSSLIPTATMSGTPYVIWGIGNYGGADEARWQYILARDISVTDRRIS